MKIKAKNLQCGYKFMWKGIIVEVIWLQKIQNDWWIEFYPSVEGSNNILVEPDFEIEIV